MHTKKQMCKDILINNNIFICPYCKKNLVLKNDILLCENNHNFDLTKKGNLFLLNTKNYKSSTIYDMKLFKSRREFIENKFYNSVYKFIAKNINSFKLDNIKILDLGCGEGIHSKYIQEEISYNNIIYGLDYSKDAISMATDYLQNGNIYFVGDINNIPLTDNSIDIIIDFLSPYNTIEINRVLKDEGYFIKIVPGDNYLKELRKALMKDDYEKKEEVKQNILKNFDIINEYEINEVKKINNQDMYNLINMTPMYNKTDEIVINEITINVIIYIMKKR